MADPEFPPTRPSIWDALRRGGRAELNRVLSLYRDPIVGYLRRRGLGAEDAEDVTQDVLSRLVHGGALERADPARGQLRALIKAVTHHALVDHLRAAAALRRGGGARHVPLEDEPAADPEAPEFDAEWALNLVLQAMYRLLDGAPPGRRRQVEAVYQRAVKGLDTAGLARELGVSPANARVLLHRGRKLVAGAARELVAEYARAGDELEAELTYLERLLPPELAWER